MSTPQPEAPNTAAPTSSPAPLPATPAGIPDPTPMNQWRAAVQQQPEWPTLPDAVQDGVLRRLRSTAFPTEPSGHTAWKHVKRKLAQGRQPDWVSLVTATFVWRVRRSSGGGGSSSGGSSGTPSNRRSQRLGSVAAAAPRMPDAFVTDAAFYDPPIDITSWPTREDGGGSGGGAGAGVGVGAAATMWLPKTESVPVGEAKAEKGGAQEVVGEEDGAGAAGSGPPGGAREGSVATRGASEATLVQQPEGRPGTADGTAGKKRARGDDDEEGASGRPQKRVDTPAGRAAEGYQGAASGFADWETKFAAADRSLADANGTIADLGGRLADVTEKLADADKKLDETATELSELRAITLSNRRITRRLLRCLGEARRVEEQVAERMARELQSLEEIMG